MTTIKSPNVLNNPLPINPKPMKIIFTPPNKHKPKTTVTPPARTQQIDMFFTTIPPCIINNDEVKTSPPHGQTTDNTPPSNV